MFHGKVSPNTVRTVCTVCPSPIGDFSPKDFRGSWADFPKKIRGRGFSTFGETLDLLRTRALRSVRETFKISAMVGNSEGAATQCGLGEGGEYSASNSKYSEVKRHSSSRVYTQLYLTILCEYMGLRKSTRLGASRPCGKSAYNRRAMWGTVTLGASLGGGKKTR